MPSLTPSHHDTRFFPSQTNARFGKKPTDTRLEEISQTLIADKVINIDSKDEVVYKM